MRNIAPLSSRREDVLAVAVLHNRMFVTLRQLSELSSSHLAADGDCIINNDKYELMSSMPLEYKIQLRGQHEATCALDQGRSAVLDELLQRDAVLHG